ncbi:MAG: KEOPS complex kinase/ATPase Bud32 [Candidatus Thalassarchaeaceae archaeon]|uniref:non-specific serine/threonine protein kinase n=1 Tax=uncultured Poseidoniia archaeon TaxID=1697135 RepID=A0A1B1TF25_9ARCH|nr:O-sialoglycoprotein endopeptidase/protein kinase [uncultured Candidatus Thalassoarchaea sp.]
MEAADIPMWIVEKVLHQGAEATVTAGSWMGKSAVLKMRKPRGYRTPHLDRKLTRQRLTVEARALGRLQYHNLSAPSIIDLDLEQGWILMSKIEGITLFDYLNNKNNLISEKIKLFGATIRELHEIGISHGDLTTHNVLIDNGGNLSLIDFGLAKILPELEHLGLDLQVLNECLTASHSEYENAVEDMVEGYLSADSEKEDVISAPEVISRFNEIRGRVRYHA